MTKTFKRWNINDRSKDYRRNDRKAFRTHFKINVSLNDDDGLDDIVIPDRKHHGYIRYHMIKPESYIERGGAKWRSPLDINGDSSFTKEIKEKFYNNTRQSKLIVEFNDLIKENEKYNEEKKEDDIERIFHEFDNHIINNSSIGCYCYFCYC
jgi:hypothetical protein